MRPRVCSPRLHRASPSPVIRWAASSPSRCIAALPTVSPASPCSTAAPAHHPTPQLQAWAELRARTEGGAFAEVVADQATTNVGDPGAGRPELVTRWIEIAGDVGGEGLLRQLSVQASRPDARTHVGDIAVPTLVLSGSADTVCPPEIQAELAAAIPGAVHVTIVGAGHMSPLDHPAAVADALRDWLESS